MFLTDEYLVGVGIDKVQFHAAYCGVSLAVGEIEFVAHMLSRLRAATAESYAEGSMHEYLKTDLGHSLVDGTDLAGGEFAGKDYLSETELAELFHLLSCTVVHLSGGVQRDRG